jgi:hypothetical protein
MGVKQRIFTRQTDFALISTIFICFNLHFNVWYAPNQTVSFLLISRAQRVGSNYFFCVESEVPSRFF